MAVRFKLNLEDISLINIFEKVTGARVEDCIVNNDKNKILFVVKEGQAGIAIGRGGINIKKLEGMFKKKVEVLEFSSDYSKFLSHIFNPINLSNVYTSEKSDGTKVVHITISKGGNVGLIKSKMKMAKDLLSKYFEINEIVFQ